MAEGVSSSGVEVGAPAAMDGVQTELFTRVVKPAEVLESLMNDGTFDGLRGKVTAHLKNNEELKQYTQSLVETSHTLNSPGAEKKTRRELFDALRRELEGPVLEKCSKSAWDLILSKEGLGKEVVESVEATYSKLSVQAEPVPADAVRRSPPELHDMKRTPSQERSNNNNPEANGYYSHPEGMVKRDRELRDGSRDRDYPDRRERDYHRSRELYERRDAAARGEYGDFYSDRTRDYSDRHYSSSREYSACPPSSREFSRQRS